MNMEIDSVVVYIGKDELVALLKKAYEEGCYGYIDLRDSVVAGIAEEYLAEHEKARKAPPGMTFHPYPHDLQTPPPVCGSGILSGVAWSGVSPSMIHSVPSFVQGVETAPVWTTVQPEIVNTGGIQITATSGHTMQFNDNG